MLPPCNPGVEVKLVVTWLVTTTTAEKVYARLLCDFRTDTKRARCVLDSDASSGNAEALFTLPRLPLAPMLIVGLW